MNRFGNNEPTSNLTKMSVGFTVVLWMISSKFREILMHLLVLPTIGSNFSVNPNVGGATAK